MEKGQNPEIGTKNSRAEVEDFESKTSNIGHNEVLK
jgi:hypothetical protein